MKNRTSRTIILGIIFIVLSILYTVLFAPSGNIRLMDSYDMLFHLNRISSLGNIFYSPVNFDYWGHVGNMTSIFYPWLTILPGFLIFQLAGNPVWGFLAFLTLITFGTFCSAYYFMKKFSNNTLQSFIFSIVYTLAFFRMASVFYRAGLAEYMSYIFIPMLFYEFYQLLSGKFSKWPLFALSFTLIVLTHPLTAFTVVILLIPLIPFTLFSKTSHSWSYWGHLLLSGFESIIMVLITTIGFSLPMIQQEKYISVNRPALLNLATTAKQPVQLFQDALGTDVRNYSFGAIMLLALVLLLIFVWKSDLKYRLVGLEMLIALILSTSIIPWSQLQNTFFNYLQFPWRFLNLFTFFAAVYISYGLARMVKNHSSLLKLLMMIIVLAGCISQTYISGNQLNHQITLAKHPAKITPKDSSKYVTGFSQLDYYPQRSLSFKKDIAHHVAVVDGQKKKLATSWDQNTYTVQYYDQKSTEIDVPVLAYKGLNVTVNNEPVKHQISKRGTALVKTNPGQNRIELSYSYSSVAKLALIVNVIGLLFLLWICFNDGKIRPDFKNKNESEQNVKNG